MMRLARGGKCPLCGVSGPAAAGVSQARTLARPRVPNPPPRRQSISRRVTGRSNWSEDKAVSPFGSVHEGELVGTQEHVGIFLPRVGPADGQELLPEPEFAVIGRPAVREQEGLADAGRIDRLGG